MGGDDEKYILVGNGATELINAIIQELKGKIGVILPTFQEYPARIKNAQIVEFIPDNADFSYTKEDLIKFEEKIDTLVLINPDNPSGNYIPKNNVISIVEHYQKKNKRVILDESFVDFSEELDENSLIIKDIIEKYPNLVIIKSISKSYGVPGIRLGIAVSSDVEFMNKCYKNLSIWNINSYAEGFLQILNKYTKTYKNACKRIMENRNIFYNKLAELKMLRPIKSQANYILCEVKSPYKSREICKTLLKEGFLIKDCQNKPGFNGKQYVRIAVKTDIENNELISILREKI